MSAQPPAFENADKCRGCQTAFSLFTRKHHCRNCGRTYCNNCSSASLPLPHFGISEAVRCCADCEKEIKSGRAGKPAAPAASAAPPARRAAAAVEQKQDAVAPAPVSSKKVRNCTCNSPLCICVPDEEEKPTAEVAKPAAAAAVRKPQQTTQPSPAPSAFLGFGGSKPTTVWNLNGDLNEQIREAVKAQDVDGINKLLGAGADARYIDRTGNSLVHLAAMFNRADIVEILHKRGADLFVKNPAGETPVDLAPPALQRRMREWQPKA